MAINTNHLHNNEMDKCEVLVLLSGGVDSAACLHFYKELGRLPCALFVDYGQLAAEIEKKCAREIVSFYSVPIMISKWSGPTIKNSGLINGRNAFLLFAALMERPENINIISIGLHSGVDYPDCSQEFIKEIQSIIDIYDKAKVDISAPFINFTKYEIYSYCRKNNIPIELTYSCEEGKLPPCRKCLSCIDRELLNVSC